MITMNKVIAFTDACIANVDYYTTKPWVLLHGDMDSYCTCATIL